MNAPKRCSSRGSWASSNFFHATVMEAADGRCRLAGGDLNLTARSEGLAVGSSAVVVVRPERVRVVRLADAMPTDAENTVTGTIADVIYLGSVKKYVVRLGSGQEVSVTEQAGSDPRVMLERSAAVRLLWRSDDAVALPGP